MRRHNLDATINKDCAVPTPPDRGGVVWATALACAGLSLAGCSITNNATDAGDGGGNGQDSDTPATGNDGSTNDGGTPTVDSGHGGDATVDGGTGADAAGSSPDGSTPDASGDGAAVDGASANPDAAPTYDSGLNMGHSCISKLFGTYVLRWDGVLIWEYTPTTPQTIVEASTGNPLKGIVNVQEGNYHGCAALTGGGVECWQTNAANGNTSGQLGNGTTTAVSALYRATPVLTGPSTPLTNVVAVAPGSYTNSACAVTSDGKLWCWGDLTWLVKGGTTTLKSGYAQAITTDGSTALTGVSSAALGPAGACVLISGTPNTVWCWGHNASGELGQGDTTARQYPTQVLGLANPTSVVYSFALTSTVVGAATGCVLDGANVRCWGYNLNGAAGTNTATNPIQSPTPVVLQGGALLGSVDNLQAGVNGFAVHRTDDTLWTWGSGFQGYAANYGLTNVVAIGWEGPSGYQGPRFVTSDSVYHNAMTTVTVNCNAM